MPGVLECFLRWGVVGRAVERGTVQVNIINLRDFGIGRHKVVDDAPYGGGPGMVLKPEPIVTAYQHIAGGGKPFVILTEPGGEPFTQETAVELSGKKWLVIICGRYGGVDERVESIVDMEISIGDYVLSGGELPAVVVMDAVIRLLPGVLGNKESLTADSFTDRGLLSYPVYTRPREFMGMKVPDVLLSGNHREIERWRKLQALKRTLEKRPRTIERLRAKGMLSQEELELLEEIKRQAGTPPLSDGSAKGGA